MYPKTPKDEGLWTDRLHGKWVSGDAMGREDNRYFADVIRAYQSKQLYDNFKLTSLYIYRTAISKSFENQVLAR